ncbi:hypothetical protein FACS1894151_01620 [Spirochaetia bacterium]|nr:hypothetical protein FACS1894151_01620 [Spirochaetia bacterium]
MADQTRLDRLNQGMDKLDTRSKQYIERLTSRLLHGLPGPTGPPQTDKTLGKPASSAQKPRIL